MSRNGNRRGEFGGPRPRWALQPVADGVGDPQGFVSEKEHRLALRRLEAMQGELNRARSQGVKVRIKLAQVAGLAYQACRAWAENDLELGSRMAELADVVGLEARPPATTVQVLSDPPELTEEGK